MKKIFYEKPLSEALDIRLESNLLAASGEPGSDLHPLEPIEFGTQSLDPTTF